MAHLAFISQIDAMTRRILGSLLGGWILLWDCRTSTMKKNQFLGFVAEQAKLCNFCILCKETSSCKTTQGRRRKKKVQIGRQTELVGGCLESCLLASKLVNYAVWGWSRRVYTTGYWGGTLRTQPVVGACFPMMVQCWWVLGEI